MAVGSPGNATLAGAFLTGISVDKLPERDVTAETGALRSGA